jgi:diguanylate cyclase (GGDEF)-like protein
VNAADDHAVRTMKMLSPAVLRQGRRLSPFAAAATLPYALLVVPPMQWHAPQLLASIAVTLLVGAGAVFVPWVRLPPWTHVLPSLGYLAGLALLRHAGAGVSAGVAVLVLLPIFWVSLHGTRAQLGIVVCAGFVMLVAPVLLFGPPEYPVAGVRAALLLSAIAGIVGVAVQELVGRIRQQAREREALLAHVSELANTDPLTGLPNRRAWGVELERAIARARRTGEPLTVALLDLDHFKAFNDTHGHEGGDNLLARSAAAWRADLRPDDVIARIGGDEFAILLPACHAVDAVSVLERLLTAMEDAPTCSIGFAQWDEMQSAAQLVQEADTALYRAKRGGRCAAVAALSA